MKSLRLAGSLLLLGSLLFIAPPAGAAATKPFEGLVAGPDGWAAAATKQPGESAAYLMAYHNLTASTQRGVSVTARPPAGSQADESSITLYTPAYPNGTKKITPTSDGVGIAVGTLKPGQTAFVRYSLTLPAKAQLACGDNAVVNRLSATVASTGQHYSASPTVTIHRSCPAAPAPAPTAPAPLYRCDAFEPTAGSGGYVAISNFSYTAEYGATYLGTAVDWGDGTQTPRQTDLHLVSHGYAKNGRYDIVASVYFSVKGQGTRAVSCHKVLAISNVAVTMPPVSRTAQPPRTPVTTTAAPAPASTPAPVQTVAAPVAAAAPAPAAANPSSTTLVNTGAGNVPIITTVIAIVLGTAGYHFWLRRLLRS